MFYGTVSDFFTIEGDFQENLEVSRDACGDHWSCHAEPPTCGHVETVECPDHLRIVDSAGYCWDCGEP